MVTALTVLVIVLSLCLGAALRRIGRFRARYQQRGLLGNWPIPRVQLTGVDPAFSPSAHGPSRESEVSFVGDELVPGGISDRETWILCTLAKRARSIFEFGTCSGKTAYLLARNAPEDGTVTTITLSPDQVAEYRRGVGDDELDTLIAKRESSFASFYYSGTGVEKKVRQLFGDSKAFDESPFVGLCDLIFVDGSHAESYVLSDSRKALRMVRPGGFVFWHDYRGPFNVRGVYRALNALLEEVPLRHIAGTALVYYQRPAVASVGAVAQPSNAGSHAA